MVGVVVRPVEQQKLYNIKTPPATLKATRFSHCLNLICIVNNKPIEVVVQNSLQGL